MTLLQLEEIVRPQFLWDKQDGRQWFTIEKFANNFSGAKIGIQVFSGVALMFGFSEEEIAKHCGVEKKLLATYKSNFVKAYNECFMASVNTLYQEGSFTSKRMMAKTRLVINAIKLTYNLEPIYDNTNHFL